MSLSSATKSKKDETDDPVELMLKKTGCIDLHYEVQECFFETQDWRKCQEPIKRFKECMNVYQKKQEANFNS